MECLDPPLEENPEGDWLCPRMFIEPLLFFVMYPTDPPPFFPSFKIAVMTTRANQSWLLGSDDRPQK